MHSIRHPPNVGLAAQRVRTLGALKGPRRRWPRIAFDSIRLRLGSAQGREGLRFHSSEDRTHANAAFGRLSVSVLGL